MHEDLLKTRQNCCINLLAVKTWRWSGNIDIHWFSKIKNRGTSADDGEGLRYSSISKTDEDTRSSGRNKLPTFPLM
jgi:hypothetical protein